MNLFELFVKVDVDDQASRKLSGITEKLGNGLKTAAKVGTAAVSAAAAGVAALTTAAVKNYAEYEQLVGGVETLFKDSADTVMKYAENAYKTAGMSANEYMSTVTSFSASLLQSLGGDTEAAAEYANQALTDMSDNANKMGTDMEMIQNAYQGFAKANYTMLDNLKLGYGGTKEEMARLIADAAELSDTVDAQDMSFANIVKAINVVQTEMGITGTTAKEAASTISGSVSTMKSAWTNFTTALAGGGDVKKSLQNLIKSFEDVGKNVVPVVEEILTTIAEAIAEFAPEIIEKIPEIFDKLWPPILEAAISLVQSLADYLPEILGSLIDAIIQAAPLIISGIVTAFTAVVELLPQLIQQIADALPTLVPQIIAGIAQMVVILVQNLPAILAALADAFINLFVGVLEGIKEVFSIEEVGEFFSGVWDSIKGAFSSVGSWFRDKFQEGKENARKAWDDAKEVFSKIWDKTKEAFADLGDWFHDKFKKGREKAAQAWADAKTVFSKIWDKVKEPFANAWSTFKDIGKQMIDGIKQGISEKWNNLKEWFTGLWNDLVGGVKNILGIHSPSRVFANIGENMALGVEKGWGSEYDGIRSQIEKDMDFGTVGVDFASSAISGGLSKSYEVAAVSPITIVVQSVLDGEVIGETAYRYSHNKAALIGA